MKKIILIYFCFISFLSYSQNRINQLRLEHRNGLNVPVPPPPYAIATLENITGIGYYVGNSSLGSPNFMILASGLIPSSSSLTISITSNSEFFDGSSWISGTTTILYSSGATVTPNYLKVRLKNSLSAGTYTNESVLLISPNATTFTISLSGTVSFYPFILDVVSGAKFAYSMYKLRNSYSGYCVNVRRSIDGSTMDIGFDTYGNYMLIDTVMIKLFSQGGDVYVTTLYDQSGNGIDLSQSTALLQPKIISSGSLILSNGLPSIYFDGTMTLSFSRVFLTDTLINFSVISRSAINKRGVYLSDGPLDLGEINSTYLDNKIYSQFGDIDLISNGVDLDTSYQTRSCIFTAATSKNYKNGIEIISTLSMVLSANSLNGFNNSNGYLGEEIFYDTDVSSKHTLINSDEKNRFNIP